MNPTQAILIGGGIGSLAAAAFLIRDAKMPGTRITIYESASALGGALDGSGDATHGYSMRGGRMLTTDNYECTWDLYKSIPSLRNPGKSVLEETLEFNEVNRAHSQARLVNSSRAKVPVTSMGFSMQDRLELLELSQAAEESLAAKCITDVLSPSFFKTPFWAMWSTTFAFQPWHSAIEFRRYLLRFLMEFSRIETLGGVKRTIYNQYDSLVDPLIRWLAAQGVHFITETRVSALAHSTIEGDFTITSFTTECHGQTSNVSVPPDCLLFLQNASMTDASSIGSMTTAPLQHTKQDSHGWELWESLAAANPQFGKPHIFNQSIPETWWESFTVTLPTPDFFDRMQHFSGNVAGTGGLVTFEDSNWMLSIVLAHQPHFPNQPSGVHVFWGYSLFPDRIGNYVAKSMADCNGAEILTELCGHLRFDSSCMAGANCIPCRMPYLTSMFMPRSPGDRPLPVPPATRNFALLSQFVEIPEDVVFTVEFSVRAAQTAVYQLMSIERPVPAVTPHAHSITTQFEALLKAFK